MLASPLTLTQTRAFRQGCILLAFSLFSTSITQAASTYALSFDGVNDYVTAGPAPGLGGKKFALECWFKRTGAGVSVSTGSGGVTAIPLITKGRGEADGDNRDMNYFLGIRASDGVIVADFEEGATGTTPGLNHPVIGKTPVVNNQWYHAAASFDGSNFVLYLNGVFENQLTTTQPPRHDSIQHAAIGTALDSTGAASGFFQGTIDEVRIWSIGRNSGDICESCKLEVAVADCLTAHYALDDGSGTTASNDCGTGINATLMNGPAWVTGYQSLFLAGAQPPPGPPAVINGLDLRHTDYVTFGNAGVLALTSFTIELWFRREGPGTTFHTGTANNMVPLVTKGRHTTFSGNSTGDAVANRNINYALGIRSTDNRLYADFETSAGQNYPIVGNTTIVDEQIYHAAVTFDQATRRLRLYLNGAQDATEVTVAAGHVPNSSSIQHACIGTAMDNTGHASRAGGFDGVVDDVRIWNVARSAAEILYDRDHLPESHPNLVAAWGMDQSSGAQAIDFNDNRLPGNIRDNNNNPVSSGWVTFTRNPPAFSSLSPLNNALDVTHFPTLKATFSDPDSSSLSVAFYGRELYSQSPPPRFTIVLIPDTQHYVNYQYPANHDVYWGQTAWITANRYNPALGEIVFVSHLGDIVENRDEYDSDPGPGQTMVPNTAEWQRADAAQAELDFFNIPNNVAVGNHDVTPAGVGNLFDLYFPPSRYEGFSWYGGWMGKTDEGDDIPEAESRNNKNNFELFDVGHLKFIILHLEMDIPATALAWADAVLDKYTDRRAIITTHSFINASGNRSSVPLYRTTGLPNSSEAIWDTLVRTHCNIFLVVNGHHSGEARRIDLNDCGLPVIQLCQDYQDRRTEHPPAGSAGDIDAGGNGYLRYLVFEPWENKIRAYTYSTHIDRYEVDGNSQFTLDYDMRGPNFEVIHVQNNVAPGEISKLWTVFNKSKQYTPMRQYEWYVEASDGVNLAHSARHVFTTRADTFAGLGPYQSGPVMAVAVNNTRKVVGGSGNPSTAVWWQVTYSSGPQEWPPVNLLAVPGSTTDTAGTGIGWSKAVGNAVSFGQWRGFYSEGGSAGGLPPSSYSPVYAYGINNHQTAPTAVGSARAANGRMHASSWNLSGVPTLADLAFDTMDEGQDSAAYDINDLATPQIAGEVTTPTPRPVVWRNGAGPGATSLPFPGTDDRGTARGINNKEKVVGSTWNASQNLPRAVQWDYGAGVYTPVVLPLPPGLPANSPSYALKINNQDVIVGYAYDASGVATGYSWPPGNVALVWVNGTVYFVYDLVPPDYGIFHRTAYDINDSMDIVGELYSGDGYMMSR